jgi:isoquinoline 1-oxidoreductase beta subunit
MMQRRQFLKTTALLGGGVAIGFHLTGCDQVPYPGSADDVRPNAFLQLNSTGEIVLQLHKSEMGQGVYTAMATLAAEEIGIHPSELKIEHAQFHPEFRDPSFKVMITGGSSSLSTSFLPLREAGAVMGALLRHAASYQLGVKQERLTLQNGMAGFEDKKVSFAELLPVARKLPMPSDVALRSASDFRYIGKFDQRLDSRDKVTGKAMFGLDSSYPDALTAVLVRCPHSGGSLKKFDAKEAKGKPGVESIFEIDGKIAVVAKGYWQARQAANIIDVEWNKGPFEGLSQSDLLTRRKALLDSEDRRKAEEIGDETLFAGEDYSAEYQAPYLAHATMEPMNALAAVTQNGLEIWTGIQAIDLARNAIADATGFTPEEITIHNTMLGGGFGRRLTPDYMVEAAQLAVHLKKPVKLIWSREDDMRHDFYRPAAMARMSAKLSGNKVNGIYSELVAPSIFKSFLPMVTNTLLPNWVPDKAHRYLGDMASGYDPSATEGVIKSPYQFPYARTDYIEEPSPVQVGYWRSVGHSQNAFFMESFVDELAHQAEQDPLDFRLRLLPPDSPYRAVLKLAAEKAGWGNPQEGRYQGLAFHESFGTPVAQVVDVSIEHGQIRVHKVVCVLDCGLAVNPDIVKMQMESGIVFGLTAALKGEISFQDGAVQQSNFHNYELLRLFETPEIEVYRIDSQASPSGVGEPGVPPIAAAVANAVFVATGQRLRSLPLRLAAS